MMTTQRVICNTGTLAPYQPTDDSPWNAQRVRHLFRRVGWGVRQEDIPAHLAAHPRDLVEEMIAAAKSQPTIAPPEWAECSGCISLRAASAARSAASGSATSLPAASRVAASSRASLELLRKS
nr:hypothetical protein [Saprospiraceae bacterium]